MAMKLDGMFAREIKKAVNGDGSREARFAFLGQARAAAREISTTNVASTFDEVLKKYGRVTVAICVAATIDGREPGRLDPFYTRWAREVLGLWTNRGSMALMSVRIDDGLHPTRIQEYAGGLIRATTLEE